MDANEVTGKDAGLKDEEENQRLAQWDAEKSIVKDSLIQTLTGEKKKKALALYDFT